MLAALRASPINPKENKKKKRQKKKKKESHYFKGARIAMQGFWKKYYLFYPLKSTTEKKSGDFIYKIHFNLADQFDAPLALLSFFFWVCV
ncbi:MAG: hypothetical protein IPF58_13545 [Saprospirales bacterium]|nr:hypothetical protein [Saprospirales bacterium]